jgi:tetratricopeptide (TPR) repeat protein
VLKNLEQLILSANFKDAEAFYHKMGFQQFDDEIIVSAHANENIMNYTFIHYLLMKEESAKLHNLAFSLFVHALTPIDGAYHCALYHAQRAIELTNEQDVGDLENLLFIYGVPDQVVSDEKAIETCHKILALEPSNEIAKSVLKKVQRRMK